MMIQTTKLPTDVSSQSNELLRLLDEVKQEQNTPELIVNDGDELDTISRKERLIYQLRQREDILKTKYLVQQVVAINQQNIEFFIWVFGDTLAEIDSNTRTTLTIASSHGFAPKVVSVEKKEELLTQYYNFNDSLNVSLTSIRRSLHGLSSRKSRNIFERVMTSILLVGFKVIFQILNMMIDIGDKLTGIIRLLMFHMTDTQNTVYLTSG